MVEGPPVVGLPGHIEPHWTPRRAAQIRVAIDRRMYRRRVVFRVVATCTIAVAAGVVALFAIVNRRPEVALERSTASEKIPRAARTEPVATPLTADTELVVDPQGAGRAFVLRRGRARFVVAHDERHVFRVRAGALLVEDLGTRFSVGRLSEYQFDVAVEEGRVAVLCEGHRVELSEGARRTFACGEPEKTVTAASPNADGVLGVPSRSKAGSERTHGQRPAWRLLAEQGQYREAYDSLRSESDASVRDETNELLLAADTARLSGHSSEAVPYLRRILLQHGEDPRAHLVAFTLGRVLLDELGRPAEAAEAFERARARRVPLAEDALAREIEAWARAGDPRRAHALALDYRRNYPEGRRMRAVAKFGGLER